MDSNHRLIVSREAAGKRLLSYVQLSSIPVERQLEMSLDVLRELPDGAGPAEAVARLRARLDGAGARRIPPSCPPVRRRHMPSQHLGGPHGGGGASARRLARRGRLHTLMFLAVLVAASVLLPQVIR